MWDWSRPYGTRPEIHAYMEHVVEKYGLSSRIRFDTPVVSARWDDDGAFWTVTTAAGEELEFDVVVAGMGMFNELNWPDIPGLESFAGTSFHSARWNWDHDLTGEHVAVIGSAASAVQFIPEIAKDADQLSVFQRAANWVLPKVDAPYTEEEREHFRRNPEAVAALRQEIFDRVDPAITFSNPEALELATAAGLQAIEVVVDPDVRRKLRPQVPYGCQRPLISSEY
jgi:cation diffusion facilitator CzcD-associated flavoprotein CzcO